jgi:hypothetical protein
MAAAWACYRFKTGMHAAWYAAASKPACVLHGMHVASAATALEAAAAAACMRACVTAFVIDTIYQLTRRRRPGRGESIFRIEIFEINGHGQKGELGGQPPELALQIFKIV